MTQAANTLLEEFDALQERDRRRSSTNCSDVLPRRHTICRILRISWQSQINSSSNSIDASSRGESATAGF